GILGIDPPTVLGHNVGDDLTLLGLNLSSTQQYFYLILAFVLVVLFLSYRLRDSRLGRAWVAIREDEDAAQAMGINTTQAKLLAYCLGASTAGITGAISAGWSQSVYPDSFLFTESLNVLAMVILGGMGSIPGAILGAAALVGLPEIFREFQMFRMLVYSLVLIAVMIYRPQGILGSERVRHELMPEEAAAVPELAAGDVAGGGK
ncbi:MAG: branched-chain amino acid ABC transporter permease, partial [Chloroflexota bacterium]